MGASNGAAQADTPESSPERRRSPRLKRAPPVQDHEKPAKRACKKPEWTQFAQVTKKKTNYLFSCLVKGCSLHGNPVYGAVGRWTEHVLGPIGDTGSEVCKPTTTDTQVRLSVCVPVLNCHLCADLPLPASYRGDEGAGKGPARS